MPYQQTVYRVFIASPGGLIPERKAFAAELERFNRLGPARHGVRFEPVGWETKAGGAGRPQSKINEEVRQCDFFVLLLHDRWGSRTGAPGDSSAYSSGTEEEYAVARECLLSDEHDMADMLLCFKAVDPSKLSDPGPQLLKVLGFKALVEREREHLYKEFEAIEGFRDELAWALNEWLDRHLEAQKDGEAVAKEPAPPPADEAADPEPVEVGGEDVESLIAEARRLADEGRTVEAEVLFARATARGDSFGSFNEYGLFLTRIGRLEQARVLFERALDLATEQDDPVREAIAYGNLGIVLQSRGDLDGAEAMHRKSLEIEERLGRQEGMASDYGNLGLVLDSRGDLDGAEAMHRRSLEIEERLGRQEGMASQYGNLGLVLQSRGDLDGAEAMYRKSLEIEERLGRQEGMASQYGNLGGVLQSRGDLDGARGAWSRSLDLFRSMGIDYRAEQVEEWLAGLEAPEAPAPPGLEADGGE